VEKPYFQSMTGKITTHFLCPFIQLTVSIESTIEKLTTTTMVMTTREEYNHHDEASSGDDIDRVDVE